MPRSFTASWAPVISRAKHTEPRSEAYPAVQPLWRRQNGGSTGTPRALLVSPKNTRSGHQFGFRFGPRPLFIRAGRHLADGYLLLANG